jgi:hypothetical protein
MISRKELKARLCVSDSTLQRYLNEIAQKEKQPDMFKNVRIFTPLHITIIRKHLGNV